ncbi:hypothetical protein [Streptomyces sp. NPDC048419]|uniref:hypothetical protein n=1 Tax=Streptomyces sp. NPDC048419 TaxID=3365547 RepID=UPI0037119CC0
MNVRIARSPATIRRFIVGALPGLANLTAEGSGQAESVASDGKSARCSRHGQAPAAHLLAEMTSDGRTVAQLRVPDKTNQITCFAALLARFA